MIRCLQCEFENPDSHKFCQNCGSVLSVNRQTDTNVESQHASIVAEHGDGQTIQASGEHAAEEQALDTVYSPQDSAPSNISDSPSDAPTVPTEPSSAEPTLDASTDSAPGLKGDIKVEDLEFEDLEFPPPTPLLAQPCPWLAILTINDPLDAEFFDPDVVDLTAIADLLQQRAIALQEKGYLDDDQRYRINDCVLKTPTVNHVQAAPYLEISLFDDNPNELSQLDQLLSQQNPSSEVISDIQGEQAADSDPSQVQDVASIDHPADLTPEPLASPDSDDSEDGYTADIRTVSPTEPNPENSPPDDSTSDEVITEVLMSSKASTPSSETDDNQADERAMSVESSDTHTLTVNAEPAIASSLTPSLTPGLSSPAFTIPNLAIVYLDVQDQFYPSLPQIHDAWMMNDMSVILVENRNDLQRLDDAIQEPEVNALQVLHWFHEMTELWGVLYPKHYHSSLLDLANLRVDEDHILCLTCLYRPSKKADFPLSLLGKLWQGLLQQSPLHNNDDLVKLCESLAEGELSSLNALRFQLEDVAMKLHDESLVETDLHATDGAIAQPIAAAAPLEDSASPLATAEQVDDAMSVTAPPPGEMPSGDEAPTVVLPMRLFHLSDVGATDIGRQRDHNEDYFSIQSETQKQDTPIGRKFSARGLYILCDGMGGHAAGEVASALAVTTLETYFGDHWTDQFPTPDVIREGICQANQSIYDLNQEKASYGSGRMGTTLVMMLVDDIKVAIAHVGDSRVYKFCRRTGLEQITVDHEVGQREIQRGVEPAIAYARPDAYQLTQALGPRDSDYINPSIQTLEVNEDTLFILCSDGLSDNNLLEQFCDTHVEPMLSSQANLSQELTNLIDLANKHNGHDNITAIAVRMKVRPKVQGLQ
jgi:serine/threonine protein phosphatase PrpC